MLINKHFYADILMKKHFFLILLIGLYGFTWPFSILTTQKNTQDVGTDRWIKQQMTIMKSQGVSIDNKVLHLSLTAYANAKKKGYSQNHLLTVIDYSKPSS